MTPQDVKYLVVHCSATTAKLDIGANEIRRMHRQRGFLDVGYHFVIRRNGTVEIGRPASTVGAHVSGHNSHSLGICMVGGLDEKGKPENNFTREQFESLTKLLVDLRNRGYYKAEILGHRDLSPDKDGDGAVETWEWVKDCPCFDVRQWWKEMYPQK